MRAARQARGEGGGEHGGERPHHHAQPVVSRGAVAEQAVAPNGDRKDQGQRTEPQ
jgi:hypothetical protein